MSLPRTLSIMTASFSLAFVADVIQHSILPSLSIVLASLGFWALGMRAMMVSISGEDYMLFAEAKGLKSKRVFLGYAMRNALLPQTTTLALSLGTILSGALLVEVVFNYPGLGLLMTTIVITAALWMPASTATNTATARGSIRV